MELVKKYFPELSEVQLEQFAQLKPLYEEWNAKINVISRKDMEHFYLNHVLHSLSICKAITIKPHEHIMDVGTGGGFPGIPLAIYYPENQFTLVDSIGKKIKVVNAVAEAIGLSNVKAFHERAEKLDIKVDKVVSRAVAPAVKLIGLTRTKLKPRGKHIFIKGGELTPEKHDVFKRFRRGNWKEYALKDIYEEDFFETKKVVVYYP